MKVIEPGKLTKEWTIRHRCTGWGYDNYGCDALLEIDRSDLRYASGVTSAGIVHKDPCVCFKCPCCGTITSIGINDWPPDYKLLKTYSPEWACCDETAI